MKKILTKEEIDSFGIEPRFCKFAVKINSSGIVENDWDCVLGNKKWGEDCNNCKMFKTTRKPG